MYTLPVAAKSGGAFDLGAGDRPCLKCAHLQRPADRRDGYLCGLYHDAQTGVLFQAADLRRDTAACGPMGESFVEIEPASKRDRRPLFARPRGSMVASQQPCTNCRHFIATQALSPNLCARFALPLTGDPMDVQQARGSSSICGPGGAGFEATSTEYPQAGSIADDTWYRITNLDPEWDDWLDALRPGVAEVARLDGFLLADCLEPTPGSTAEIGTRRTRCLVTIDQ